MGFVHKTLSIAVLSKYLPQKTKITIDSLVQIFRTLRGKQRTKFSLTLNGTKLVKRMYPPFRAALLYMDSCTEPSTQWLRQISQYDILLFASESELYIPAGCSKCAHYISSTHGAICHATDIINIMSVNGGDFITSPSFWR